MYICLCIFVFIYVCILRRNKWPARNCIHSLEARVLALRRLACNQQAVKRPSPELEHAEEQFEELLQQRDRLRRERLNLQELASPPELLNLNVWKSCKTSNTYFDVLGLFLSN